MCENTDPLPKAVLVEYIDHNEHVGKMLVTLDIHTGVSPFVKAIMPADLNLDLLVQNLQTLLNKALEIGLAGGEYEYTLDPIEVKLHPATGIILPQAERLANGRKALKEVQTAFQSADAVRQKDIDTKPDLQQEGWYRVEGIRHSAIVRAMSGRQAVEKAIAGEHVGSWETPEPRFIAAELPDIVSC